MRRVEAKQCGYVAKSSDEVLSISSEVFKNFSSKEIDRSHEANLTLSRIYVGTTKMAKFTFDMPAKASFELTETIDQRFTIPTYGRCLSRSRSGDIVDGSKGIYAHVPSEYFEIETAENFSWIGLTFKRERIARTFEALTGIALNGHISFDHGLSMRPPEQRTLSAIVDMVMSDYSSGSSLLNLVSRQSDIEDLIIKSILMSVPHDKSNYLNAPSSPAAPSHVKRAMDYIASNISGPICLEDLVNVSGVSERALHEAFKKFRGMSPMSFARNYRLDKIRQNLLSPATGETVSGIAIKWGTRHLGRFSQAYQERFGESPSMTYRRSHSKH
ncbi:MAG: helix-turn-helix transcriptional regulator [Alphaproteobacteria bacterium]